VVWEGSSGADLATPYPDCVPSMGVDRRCKSSGELVAATHTNRKATSRETGSAARPMPKEAGSETASRRTGSTHSKQHRVRRIEALCAQGERAFDREALATKGPGRKSDGCAGSPPTLTWGDLALYLKG